MLNKFLQRLLLLASVLLFSVCQADDYFVEQWTGFGLYQGAECDDGEFIPANTETPVEFSATIGTESEMSRLLLVYYFPNTQTKSVNIYFGSRRADNLTISYDSINTHTKVSGIYSERTQIDIKHPSVDGAGLLPGETPENHLHRVSLNMELTKGVAGASCTHSYSAILFASKKDRAKFMSYLTNRK